MKTAQLKMSISISHVCKLLTVVLVIGSFGYLEASTNDSLKVSIGTILTAGNKDFQPHWIVSNRYGVIQDRKSDASTNFRLSNSHRFDLRRGTALDSLEALTLSYGLNIFNNNGFDDFLFGEAFAKLKYRNVEFRAGRYRSPSGEMDQELSTGSFGISPNALPIPRISLVIPEYVDLPYSGGFVKIKGSLSHGWMGNNQHLKKAFLHEKSLYAKFGKNRFRIFAGLQHFGVWGGQRGEFKLDRSFAGFLDVLMVKEANDGSLDTALYPGTRPNRAGDQRGLIEYGAEWENNDRLIRIYNQTPFESGKGIDVRNIDRLLGASIFFKGNRRALKKIVFEFIYTKQMEDFGGRERQSYYNNGVYRTGWEYETRVIGTPLFTNLFRASKFLDVTAPDWKSDEYTLRGNGNIVNNRILGGHVGLDYQISTSLSTRTLLTYTVNNGSLNKNIPILSKQQVYFMQDFSLQLSDKVDFNLALGYDTGEMYKNLGVLFGVKYAIFK